MIGYLIWIWHAWSWWYVADYEFQLTQECLKVRAKEERNVSDLSVCIKNAVSSKKYTALQDSDCLATEGLPGLGLTSYTALLQHPQVFNPRTHFCLVLRCHRTHDLVDVSKVMHGPGCQQLG